jgi:hypothetical protein
MDGAKLTIHFPKTDRARNADWVAGPERVVRNPALRLPAREFEFSDPDVARIKAAIEDCDSYGAAADRRWLAPLANAAFYSGTQHQAGD